MHGFGVVCLLLAPALFARAQVSPVPAGPRAQAQPADVKTEATPFPGQHALEAADLESFFDGIIPLQLERSDIAGASVLVMQNGQVLLEKGYGYADLKSKKRVDPATTAFRLASFSKPIPLRNLMTHTGGFEEEIRDIIVTNPSHAIALRDFLIRNQPQRVFAPGTIPAYSNYGGGLAGYIVQRGRGE